MGFKRLLLLANSGREILLMNSLLRKSSGKFIRSVNWNLGNKLSGKLNFPRRVATTMLAAASRDRYKEFFEKIKKALDERNIRAPVYILKADGGTLPIEKSMEFPVETIFSGPAASTIGALALTPENETSVVVDIGGTTTDLALILSGKPLLASKGAKLGGFLTQVRAFAVRSIAVGGDSIVRIRDSSSGIKEISIGPERAGPALNPVWEEMRLLLLMH